MRRLLLIVAAIALIVAAEVVWLAPATLVARHVEEASGGALRLADTEGTVWHARGMLLGGGSRLPIAWDLEFWPLLRGEARLRVGPYAGTPSGPPRANLTVRGGAVSARDVDVVVPAPMVAALAPLPAGWKADGEIAVSAASFEWMPPTNLGELAIVWRGARLALPAGEASLDLGDVTVGAAAQGDAVAGAIRNQGGTLSVQGDWTASASGGTDVRLVLVPRADADSKLVESLGALAPRSEAGWRVEWRTPAR